MELTTEQKLEIAIDQLRMASISAALHDGSGKLRHEIERTLVVLDATPANLAGINLGDYLAFRPSRCGMETGHGPCERPTEHDGSHAVARESFLRSVR